jgi:hypothetical protein
VSSPVVLSFVARMTVVCLPVVIKCFFEKCLRDVTQSKSQPSARPEPFQD